MTVENMIVNSIMRRECMCTFFDGTVYSVGNGFCYEGILQHDSIQFFNAFS